MSFWDQLGNIKDVATENFRDFVQEINELQELEVDPIPLEDPSVPEVSREQEDKLQSHQRTFTGASRLVKDLSKKLEEKEKVLKLQLQQMEKLREQLSQSKSDHADTVKEMKKTIQEKAVCIMSNRSNSIGRFKGIK